MDTDSLRTGYVVALESLDNRTLAALNLAIQLKGKVPADNVAYKIAVDKAIIKDDGEAVDLETLRDALAFVVNQRFTANL